MNNTSTRNDQEDLKRLKGFVGKSQTFFSRLSSDVYNNVGAPLMDNDISNKINQGIFHTTAGRSTVVSYLTFNKQLVASFSTYFGFSMYKFAEYIISLSESQTNGIIVNLFVSFILLALTSVILQMQEQLLTDRMGGAANIIEYTNEDIHLMKKKNMN